MRQKIRKKVIYSAGVSKNRTWSGYLTVTVRVHWKHTYNGYNGIHIKYHLIFKPLYTFLAGYLVRVMFIVLIGRLEDVKHRTISFSKASMQSL